MRDWLSSFYRFLHLPAYILLSFVIVGLVAYGGKQLLDFFEEIKLIQISTEKPIPGIIHMVFEMTGTVVFIIIGHALLNTPGFKEIGIGLRNQSKYLVLGVVLALLMTLPYLPLVFLSGDSININSQFNALSMLQIFVFYTFAAIKEELFYRGFMEKEFGKLVNPKMVIPVSAIFFAWSHFYNFNFLFELGDFFYFITLVLWGLVFSLCYRYSRNIWFPTVVHLGFNGFRRLFGFYDHKHALLEIEPGKWSIYIDRYEIFLWMATSIIVIGILIRFKTYFLPEKSMEIKTV